MDPEKCYVDAIIEISIKISKFLDKFACPT